MNAAPGRLHARRLREIYRSAGWPCQDTVEIELLAAGLLERRLDPLGRETLRVTDAGLRVLAATLDANRAALSAHESLVERVARDMTRAGRIAWRGLSLRAQVPVPDQTPPWRWNLARPDVFSIRHTTVEAWVEPIVHEIKVRRADLLGDLKQPDKRAAYLDMGQCWYVLGADARGRPIGDASEIPAECGVMIMDADRLHVARPAPPRERTGLSFALWMALARATPMEGLDADSQPLLTAAPDETH